MYKLKRKREIFSPMSRCTRVYIVRYLLQFWIWRRFQLVLNFVFCLVYYYSRNKLVSYLILNDICTVPDISKCILKIPVHLSTSPHTPEQIYCAQSYKYFHKWITETETETWIYFSNFAKVFVYSWCSIFSLDSSQLTFVLQLRIYLYI